jgi:hypothetical protein
MLQPYTDMPHARVERLTGFDFGRRCNKNFKDNKTILTATIHFEYKNADTGLQGLQ